jgi:uncharacterized membrane protein
MMDIQRSLTALASLYLVQSKIKQARQRRFDIFLIVLGASALICGLIYLLLGLQTWLGLHLSLSDTRFAMAGGLSLIGVTLLLIRAWLAHRAQSNAATPLDDLQKMLGDLDDETLGTLESLVKANPLPAVATAIGVGALLSRMKST